MPKAYSYVRWSTPEQAHGGTLERQLKLSREYAAKHNLALDESYIDPGVSAYRGKNRFEGALANFIKHVESGKIAQGSYLLVESLDRLSRDKVLKALKLFISIVEAGITIVSLLDEQVYSAEDMERHPGMIMMSIGVMMRANDESRVKSHRKREDVERKLRQARESKTPITAQCPSWLRLIKLPNGKRKYEEIPERVAIIRRIYLDAVAGLGAVQITGRLNEGHYSNDGTPTPAFRGKDGWHPSSVKKILSNLAVIGFYQPHHLVDGKRVASTEPPIELYPEIIEPELFWRARTEIEQRRKGAAGRKGIGYSNLFSGLGFCEQCGAKLRYVDKGPKPKGGQYLVCSRSLRRHGCQNRTGFPHGRLEQFVLQNSTSSLVASHMLREPVDGAAERRVAELHTALTQKRALRKRLFDTFENDPDDAELQSRLRRYRDDIKELEADLVEAQKAANQEQYLDQRGWIVHVMEAHQKLDSGDPEERLLARASLAQEFRRVIEKMTLSPDRKITVTHTPGPDGRQIEYVYEPDALLGVRVAYPDGSIARFSAAALRIMDQINEEIRQHQLKAFEKMISDASGPSGSSFDLLLTDETGFRADQLSYVDLHARLRIVDAGDGIREVVPA